MSRTAWGSNELALMGNDSAAPDAAIRNGAGQPSGLGIRFAVACQYDFDNIIMDETCPLGPALRVFNADNQPRLLVNLQVETPADLEKCILDRRLDIAIGIFEGKNDYIEYRPLYRETDHLYCAPGSPLGQMVLAGRAEADILNLLNRQHFVSRKFLNQRELAWLEPKSDEQVCYASNVEAVLFIILSGQSVGFVPEHFARRWVCKGELIAVLPDKIRHQSVIEAAFLKTAGAPRPIIASFLKTLFADLP